MEREPLDSIEYESTYLELRPTGERPTVTTAGPVLARRAPTVRVDDGNGSGGRLAAAAEVVVAPGGSLDDSECSPGVRSQGVRRSGAQAIHPAGGPPTRQLRVASGRCPWVPSGHLSSRRRLPFWPLTASGLLVVVSAAIGIVADLDVHTAQPLFVALTGVLLLSWARLAWPSTPRGGPFVADITRGLDRLVTALGTFFAFRLWAKFGVLLIERG